jgi:quercetin dioxygenase-like cupin family protein
VPSNNVQVYAIRSGLLAEHVDEQFTTLVFGFVPGEVCQLPEGHTHFGVVVDGQITLEYEGVSRLLYAGDFFSVKGAATVKGSGTGITSSARGYEGLNVFGGPIERLGRLRYIDGCSDSLLVPPVRRGDPCLNFLHFPTDIVQTPHVHPSVRTGVVLRGEGVCVVPGADPIALRPGVTFVIPTNATHSFNTESSTMDVIAFHPDSDVGVTDDDHPMVNRTIVDGVSARYLNEIRTTSTEG